LIMNIEYRRHFITLCRANHLLAKMSSQNNVVTDRRRRALDQERLKRESLYFFQQKNGTATRIISQFTGSY